MVVSTKYDPLSKCIYSFTQEKAQKQKRANNQRDVHPPSSCLFPLSLSVSLSVSTLSHLQHTQHHPMPSLDTSNKENMDIAATPHKRKRPQLEPTDQAGTPEADHAHKERLKRQQRETRLGYRKMTAALDDKRDDILRADGTIVLTQSIQRANALYQSVTRPQEAKLDSAFLLEAADLAQTKARNIKRGVQEFSLDEFIIKVDSFITGGTRSLGDALQLTQLVSLGNVFAQYETRPPTMDLMLGPLMIERKERVFKAREQTKRTKASLVQPGALVHPDGASNEQQTVMTRLTMQVGRILMQQSPIDYFSLVLNPRSFAQSVENMFYLSFLIKEGKAGVYEDGGLQVVRYIADGDAQASMPSFATQGEEEGEDWPDKQQGILTLDMETWKEAVEILGLTESTIPHRDQPEDTAA
ncbi:Nse4 C-terminal-domain-containing protein [Protomyces lactucae-debilis]|uniref:Non-structural maintenance of chromosomes element 4 n=1 Tax=Protomyces lactucae-debilis TaxID=2754530 RepID=A0A1Y2EZL9_PROLT|nr:Nse4 C-terminal-domain-containing protein [Protomyces lactucae-debilis]ORY77020.1 Nse4 C-terminal-domain-containing protein [Protomyces lactucae-debilis]